MQRARRFVANHASQLLHEAAEDAYQAATEEVAVLHQGLNGYLNGVAVLLKQLRIGVDADREVTKFLGIACVVGTEFAACRSPCAQLFIARKESF
uniref:MMPL family transporter n=1 Tax=Comamonas jiangduensis TaxID=1194168 RepID=UPI0035E4133B